MLAAGLFFLPSQGHLEKGSPAECKCNRDAAVATTHLVGREAYIEMYAEMAVMEMRWSGIPASVTLAQGILESNSGTSMLAMVANNHFGIICKEDHAAGAHCVWKKDRGNWRRFLRHESVAESFRKHTLVLRKPRYRELFKLTDYRSWCYGLQRLGYSEDRKYASTLISIIETNDLTRYDN